MLPNEFNVVCVNFQINILTNKYVYVKLENKTFVLNTISCLYIYIYIYIYHLLSDSVFLNESLVIELYYLEYVWTRDNNNNNINVINSICSTFLSIINILHFTLLFVSTTSRYHVIF